MRITELEPRWIAYSDSQNGISFLCPHCKTQRLAIRCDHSAPHKVMVPHDSGTEYVVSEEQVWQISGDTPTFDGYVHGGFENVTISPSVDASKVGHWHGFITNGAVT